MEKSEWLGVKHRMSPLKEALNSILVVPRGKEKCREHKPLAGGRTAKSWQSWGGVPVLLSLGRLLFSLY